MSAVAETITHSLLIEHAAAWLRNQSHSIVITDMSSGGWETPDALGFKGYCSTLIECKASRSDFLADAKKTWRRIPEQGMGAYRYYMARHGIIHPDELPEKWGLLIVDGKRVLRAVKAESQKHNQNSEQSLLVSAIRRVGQQCPQGISVKCYTFESTNRATLGVDGECDDYQI